MELSYAMYCTGRLFFTPICILFITRYISSFSLLLDVVMLFSYPNLYSTGRSRFTQFVCAWFCCNTAWKFIPLSNVCDNFWFNAVWHTWSLVTLVLCWRLAESYVTIIPSVTCIDWLHRRHNHTADVDLSTIELAYVTKISEKCNLHHLAQFKWKISQVKSLLQRKWT